MTLCTFSVAALALAGCGSSKKSTTSTTTPTAALTQAQLARKADAICQKYDAQVAKLGQQLPRTNPATANAAQIKVFAQFLNARANAIRTEVAQVRALGAPQTGAASLSQLLAGGEHSAAQLSAAA